MKIRTKFNLAVFAAFFGGLVVAGFLLKQHFESAARVEAIETARVMMTAATAMRHYTISEITPLVGNEMEGKFLPVSVPSYAAQTIFRTVSADFGTYRYKEAALNPTNLSDRAGDWEADIINEFRNNPETTEVISERTTPLGVVIGLARPIKVGSEACLRCHSYPSVAPASMISEYGDVNGFGWKLDEVVAAQIASLPLSEPMARAHRTLYIFLGLLTGIFVLMLIIINVLLHFLVIRPVTAMSKVATEVSLGNPAEEIKPHGNDEVSALSTAFNRMRRSLERAMSMLEDT